MLGVLDLAVEDNRTSSVQFLNVDRHAAQVANVNQGLNPALSEANTRHSKAMDQQRKYGEVRLEITSAM